MALFQPAGIVAETANSFYGHLDEKNHLRPAFQPPDDNQGKHVWRAAPSSIKHCLYGEAISEIPPTQFRF